MQLVWVLPLIVVIAAVLTLGHQNVIAGQFSAGPNMQFMNFPASQDVNHVSVFESDIRPMFYMLAYIGSTQPDGLKLVTYDGNNNVVDRVVLSSSQIEFSPYSSDYGSTGWLVSARSASPAQTTSGGLFAPGTYRVVATALKGTSPLIAVSSYYGVV